jgi:hypothetical protein
MGVANEQNTCYVNAVLQAVASVPTLAKVLTGAADASCATAGAPAAAAAGASSAAGGGDERAAAARVLVRRTGRAIRALADGDGAKQE